MKLTKKGSSLTRQPWTCSTRRLSLTMKRRWQCTGETLQEYMTALCHSCVVSNSVSCKSMLTIKWLLNLFNRTVPLQSLGLIVSAHSVRPEKEIVFSAFWHLSRDQGAQLSRWKESTFLGILIWWKLSPRRSSSTGFCALSFHLKKLLGLRVVDFGMEQSQRLFCLVSSLATPWKRYCQKQALPCWVTRWVERPSLVEQVQLALRLIWGQ